MNWMKLEIACNCGDVIEAEDYEDAVKKFCEKHNFPQPNTFDGREDYAEEFSVWEIKND